MRTESFISGRESQELAQPVLGGNGTSRLWRKVKSQFRMRIARAGLSSRAFAWHAEGLGFDSQHCRKGGKGEEEWRGKDPSSWIISPVLHLPLTLGKDASVFSVEGKGALLAVLSELKEENILKAGRRDEQLCFPCWRKISVDPDLFIWMLKCKGEFLLIYKVKPTFFFSDITPVWNLCKFWLKSHFGFCV